MCIGICHTVCVNVFVFFFKQKTAYEMRISDWSSDVCSSDLRLAEHRAIASLARRKRDRLFGIIDGIVGMALGERAIGFVDQLGGLARAGIGIARADRKSTRLNSSH